MTGLIAAGLPEVALGAVLGLPHALTLEGNAAAQRLMAMPPITGSPWRVAAGLAGHGAEDLSQHRALVVADPRRWPPSCVTVEGVAALPVTVAAVAGGSSR